MKKMLFVVVASTCLLLAGMRAEKRTGTTGMYLVTSFDFDRYPACGVNRSRYCIQAIRFYDGDSIARLAEVPVNGGKTGPQPIVATIHVYSIPRHVYAVTVYEDGMGTLKEGLPGQLSTFPAGRD